MRPCSRASRSQALYPLKPTVWEPCYWQPLQSHLSGYRSTRKLPTVSKKSRILSWSRPKWLKSYSKVTQKWRKLSKSRFWATCESLWPRPRKSLLISSSLMRSLAKAILGNVAEICGIFAVFLKNQVFFLRVWQASRLCVLKLYKEISKSSISRQICTRALGKKPKFLHIVFRAKKKSSVSTKFYIFGNSGPLRISKFHFCPFWRLDCLKWGWARPGAAGRGMDEAGRGPGEERARPGDEGCVQGCERTRGKRSYLEGHESVNRAKWNVLSRISSVSQTFRLDGNLPEDVPREMEGIAAIVSQHCATWGTKLKAVRFHHKRLPKSQWR